jgi:glycosyltransferase involved in cell wall biosynthesis
MDYCLVEAITCLKDLCDHVVVVDAGSSDSTPDELRKLEDSKCQVVYLDGTEWKQQQGREKLNYFTNKAIELLTTDYQINLQADEIIHEKSFEWIRKAIETGAEGFLNRRWNMWGTPYHILNVPQNRKPCSTEIIRLTKTKYRSCGDAESMDCPSIYNFLSQIEMFHFGFVRKKEVMKKKVIHMQEEVFQVSHDVRLDKSDVFQPMEYFNPEDLVEIPASKLPKYIQEWAKTRP